MIKLLILSTLLTLSQNDPPEFGNMSELTGKRTVYVLCYELESRKSIVKQIEEYIQKRKINAQLQDSPDGAEIFIIYGSESARTGFRDSKHVGELAVSLRGTAIPNTENEPGGIRYRHRIVYSTQSSRSYSSGISFQRSPHKKAIRKFLDQWAKLQKTEKANPSSSVSATPNAPSP